MIITLGVSFIVIAFKAVLAFAMPASISLQSESALALTPKNVPNSFNNNFALSTVLALPKAFAFKPAFSICGNTVSGPISLLCMTTSGVKEMIPSGFKAL